MKNNHLLIFIMALSFFFVSAAPAHAALFNFDFGNIRLPSSSVRVSIYSLYKTFMGWVSSGVTIKALPFALTKKLAPYYVNNLSLVRYGYASRIGNLAITDCTKIYFGSKTVTDAIASNNLTATQMHWLLHELAHTEQCHLLGGRETYANTWFKDLGIALNTTSFSANFVKNVHDRMPMEKNAEAKAVDVQNKLSQQTATSSRTSFFKSIFSAAQ